MTQIVIAPTKEEKAEHKEALKKIQAQVEVVDKTTKRAVSKRNEDIFLGGPLAGSVCTHQPNGPRPPWDPKGYWADYFIRENLFVPELGRHVPGYHIYSTSLSIYAGDDGLGGYKRKGHTMERAGARGAYMRKNYFYCGFVAEFQLKLNECPIEEFRGVLTIS